MSAVSELAAQSCFRPKSYRFVDPPEVKELVKQREKAPKEDKPSLSVQICAVRKLARQAWQVDLLDKGSRGNYAALHYFRKRQSIQHSQASYVQLAGGPHKAVADLQAFYQRKYASSYEQPAELARAILQTQMGATNEL